MSMNDEIRETIKKAGSHTFSVHFIKANKEYREMVAILHCFKHLKGGKRTTEGRDDLMICFDMQAAKKGNGYRHIPLDRVMSCKVNGEVYEFRTEEEVREAMKQEELV